MVSVGWWLAGFPVVAPGLRRVAMNPKGALWRHCGIAVDPSGAGGRMDRSRRECKQVTEVTPGNAAVLEAKSLKIRPGGPLLLLYN